jgi:hypothetical protein
MQWRGKDMKNTIWILSICLLVFGYSQHAVGETVHVGTFRYLQYEEGKVKENQVENTAATPIFLKQSVAEIVTEEIVSELSSMGFTINGSSARTIQGTINKLLVDDMGLVVKYSMEIGFEIPAGTNKDTDYSKSFSFFRNEQRSPFTRKMASRMIRNCTREFVKDAQKKGVL